MVFRSHSIMFHAVSPAGSGKQHGVDSEGFHRIVKLLEFEFDVLSARDLIESLIVSPSHAGGVAMSFDDGMKCHLEYAAPWLESLGLRGIFFIHTQPLTDGFDRLVSVKEFIDSEFRDINDYYHEFNYAVDLVKGHGFLVEMNMPVDFLVDYPFYTEQDKEYRYLRDMVLTDEEFDAVVEKVMSGHRKKRLDYCDKNYWLSADDIKELHRRGHMVGLHTHTHPTNLTRLPYDGQLENYRKNKEILEEIIGEQISIASYPCGRFDQNTHRVMRALGVSVAFGSSMNVPDGNLTVPRQDPAVIMQRPG